MQFKVSYKVFSVTGNYRVSRSYATQAEAEEFISVNAMVCRLPGLERHYPDGITTECGEFNRDGKVLGHYHYAGGQCDTEPSYEMGGPA